MLPRPSSQRAPGTRVQRPHAHRGLEAVASEFALLAQRRARMLRQIELLDRQRQAADAAFQCLDARMTILGRRLARLDVGMAPPAAALPLPVPPPPEPVRRVSRAEPALQVPPPAPPASRAPPVPRPSRFATRPLPTLQPTAASRRRGMTLEY